MYEANNTTEIWLVSLRKDEAEIRRLAADLPPEDIDRSNRYATRALQNSYIAARGQLREILAEKLQITPREIKISYSEHGKPRLDIGRPLFFNLSHSNELCLIALNQMHELGVDIEHHLTTPVPQALMNDTFSPAELSKFRTLPETERMRAFYSTWTQKESVLKALGFGLFTNPNQVDLLPTDSGAYRQLYLSGKFFGILTMHELDVPAGYSASLALVGKRPTNLLFKSILKSGV